MLNVTFSDEHADPIYQSGAARQLMFNLKPQSNSAVNAISGNEVLGAIFSHAK